LTPETPDLALLYEMLVTCEYGQDEWDGELSSWSASCPAARMLSLI